MSKMTWSNDYNEYYCDIENGVLHVNGDDFSEAVHDRAKAYLEEKYSKEEAEKLKEEDPTKYNEEYEPFYDQANEELMDSDEWEANAYELEDGQTEMDIPYHVVASITKK